MRDGQEAVQVYPGQCPDHQGVDQRHEEAVDAAHAQPRHGDPGDDRGRGEEEEEKAEDRVGEPQVNKQQTAGLPCLNKKSLYLDE